MEVAAVAAAASEAVVAAAAEAPTPAGAVVLQAAAAMPTGLVAAAGAATGSARAVASWAAAGLGSVVGLVSGLSVPLSDRAPSRRSTESGRAFRGGGGGPGPRIVGDGSTVGGEGETREAGCELVDADRLERIDPTAGERTGSGGGNCDVVSNRTKTPVKLSALSPYHSEPLARVSSMSAACVRSMAASLTPRNSISLSSSMLHKSHTPSEAR